MAKAAKTTKRAVTTQRGGKPVAKATKGRKETGTRKNVAKSSRRPPSKSATRSVSAPIAKPKATSRPKAVAKSAQQKNAKPARTRRGVRKGARKKAVAAPLVRVVKVRELDPIAKCGPATSVEQLFRVDELTGRETTVHLVFFDRHGWYCVHGPRCAAVSDVHSHTRSAQRARTGRAPAGAR